MQSLEMFKKHENLEWNLRDEVQEKALRAVIEENLFG